MKYTISLVLAFLLVAVLGCSFGSRKSEKIDTPDPAATSATPVQEAPKVSPAGSGNLTIEQFNQLKTGMSYEDAVKIIGSEGTESRRSEVGSVKIISYTWEGEKRFQRIFATFRDGKLTSKTQSALAGDSADTGGSPEISMEKYEKIKTGMSYEEVVKIIGSEGEVANSSDIGGTELKSYVWKGERFSSIRATFKNGKMSSKSNPGLHK